MKRRKFYATFSVAIDVAPFVIRAACADKSMPELKTAEDVAQHLAFYMVQGRELNHVLGFADFDPKAVKLANIVHVDTEESDE